MICNPRPIAAAQGRRPRSRVKYWLAETVCGYDLVAKKHVHHVVDRIKTAENSILFNTANGNTDATDDVLLRVDELDEDIEPYVLESTPAVLSVGRRCQEYGYQFHWPAFSSKPYFVTPKGKKIELTVQDHVPYLKTKLAKPAMTATSCAEIRGIISVNRAEQHPRASPTALAGHDIARFTGRPAKANPRVATSGHEIASFTGGRVVVAPPDELIVVEDPEPEMVVLADETAIEGLKRMANRLNT